MKNTEKLVANEDRNTPRIAIDRPIITVLIITYTLVPKNIATFAPVKLKGPAIKIIIGNKTKVSFKLRSVSYFLR
jgi:hypothetical protein